MLCSVPVVDFIAFSFNSSEDAPLYVNSYALSSLEEMFLFFSSANGLTAFIPLGYEPFIRV